MHLLIKGWTQNNRKADKNVVKVKVVGRDIYGWFRQGNTCGAIINDACPDFTNGGCLMIFASVYAILVGLSMLGLWSMLYLTRQISELKTEPFRIVFHISGEVLTALMLIAGGIGLWSEVAWGLPIYLVAMGMLFYTAIVSPGYYAQKGQWAMVAMFAVLLVLGSVSLVMVL